MKRAVPARDGKSHAGIAADIIFAASYFLVPAAPAALGAAGGSPLSLYRIGTFAIFLYPAACIAIMQRMSMEPSVREGLVFLKGILWGTFTWPLGIVFWVSLLFHGVAMSMSFSWGEMMYGKEIQELVSPADVALVWTGIAFFFFLSIWMALRIWGVDVRKPFREIASVFRNGNASAGFRVFAAVMILLLAPVVLVLILSIAFVTPFYLYPLVWWYALSRASSGREMWSPLPRTGAVEVATSLVLLLYTALLAYFFDAGVTQMVGISRQGGDYIPYWIASVIVMAMYYFPYRIFLGLMNRRNRVGWVVFALTVALVYFDTYRRFME
ncbi:MAG: hypothetical protein JW838_08855 [Spirochaetes bacterium]|nr:hypothetical protein [Spirochaetota bacterium]